MGDASGVTGLKVKHKDTDEIRELPTPGVFVFVGRDVLNAPLNKLWWNFYVMLMNQVRLSLI